MDSTEYTLTDLALRLNIIDKRQRLLWKQDDVADRSGVSRATIQRIEQGRYRLPREILEIARLFGCSVAELLTPTPATEAYYRSNYDKLINTPKRK